MFELIFWLICFVVVYLLYFLLVVNNKKKLKKYHDSTEIKFLKNKFKIDIEKIGIKKLANIMALVNAFIISTTILIIEIINNLILKMIVGFIILIPFILITYTLVGRTLVKKYGQK